MLQNRPSPLHSLSLEQILDRDLFITTPEAPLLEVMNFLGQTWADRCELLEKSPSGDHLAPPISGGCALIMAESQLLGIFSEQDMVRLIAAEQALEHVCIREVMTQPVITLTATDTQDVFTALTLMRQHRIRHLPVVDEQEQVLGVVTPEAVRRVLQPTDLLRFRRVGEVMTTQVIHAPPTASVLHVAQLMTHHRVSYVVIAERFEAWARSEVSTLRAQGQDLNHQPDLNAPSTSQNANFHPIGIITERDIVQFHRLALKLEQLRAEMVMSTPLLPANPEDSLWAVCQQMQHHRVRRLVVVGPQGDLQGIVTQSSVLRVLDPIEMYGVLDLLQEKIRQLEAEKVLLMQHRNAGLTQTQLTKLTERNQAETDRDRFFSLSLDMLCVASMDGYFKRLNPAFERVLGYTTAELMAQPFLEFVHPDDRAATLAEVGKLATGVATIAFENRYRCQDGSYKWLLWTAAPYLDQQLLYAAARDITDRKQAEQKIREQAALLDVATDAILVRDLDHKILFWNQGAEHLYGWTAAEALGQDANELLDGNVLPQFADIQQTLTEQGAWYGELHPVTKGGQELIVESRWTLVQDEAGDPKSILIVDTDITEKKQLEAQFLRAQRLESLGTLAGGIAHDLNNILTPILGSTQMLPLKFPDADESTKRLLELLQISAQRGSALVKQVLSFSRGVEGEYVVLQIRHLVSEIKQIARETFPKTLDFCTDIPQDTWTVRGDVTQLHQVLMNLCVNARDAMPNGGTLSISGHNLYVDENYARMNPEAQLGPYIVITVADTGVGIPPEMVDKIFDPFFTTKATGQGTGLGLSTTLGIIKSHGGFVKVYSEVGQGTQFKVYLPAAEAVEAPKARTSELLLGQGELVLVVDDEAPIREITRTTLEMSHYTVLTASDGIEAIALYAQRKDDISVVLMDMIMPSMDGVTAIRTIQKINPQVKIIASSGLSSSDKTAAALTAGVETFLPKPYTSEVLLQTLANVLNPEASR